MNFNFSVQNIETPVSHQEGDADLDAQPLPSPAAIAVPTAESSERDPYRRACEFEDRYDWRTDPFYSEDAIRERLLAGQAEMRSKGLSPHEKRTPNHHFRIASVPL